MSDAQQAPVIQLDIDQELYIDVVREGDVMDDATVSTEVTSLNHVGDTYVLEGAIVFSGWLQREAEQAGDFATANGPAAVHPVDHRMPFLLRVPAKTQPRGIVNVASRISSWKLQVVGERWIQMEADLQISGLNGKQGFHFQCGSQEYGNLLFDGSPLRTAEPQSTETPEPSIQEDIPVESDEMELFVDPDDQPTLEYTPILEDVRAASFEDSFSAKRDLADFDRAMDGQPEPLRSIAEDVVDETVTASQVQDTADITPSTTEPDPQESPYATFEFEHQVSSDEAEETQLTTPVNSLQNEVPFSAARSFSAEGFAPHTGFAASDGTRMRTEITVSAVPETPVQLTLDAEYDNASVMVGSASGNPTTLWSFVDFNQPERSYTLRYVVVMEDETIHTLADRLGCKPADIVTENRLTSEEVYVGQTLRIPSSVVSIGVRS